MQILKSTSLYTIITNQIVTTRERKKGREMICACVRVRESDVCVV